MSASIPSALRLPRTGYRVKSRNRIRIFLVCQFDRSQRHTCNMNLQQNIKLSTFSINIIFSTLIAADTVRHQLAAADFISAVWLCNFCCPLHVRCGDATSRVCEWVCAELTMRTCIWLIIFSNHFFAIVNRFRIFIYTTELLQMLRNSKCHIICNRRTYNANTFMWLRSKLCHWIKYQNKI